MQGRIQEFLKGGVVHYRSSLEHQWCGRRVTAPASGAISWGGPEPYPSSQRNNFVKTILFYYYFTKNQAKQQQKKFSRGGLQPPQPLPWIRLWVEYDRSKWTWSQIGLLLLTVTDLCGSNSVHPDDHTQPTYEMASGIKPFTTLYSCLYSTVR